MKNKIGFIAVGQAGGNIGALFERNGYPVLYLNTSEEDLDTLKDAKYKHHIAGGEGCNKDRYKAKQLVIDDFDVISRKIEDTFNCEFIYVVFASGGGTGSGAAPMLADLLVGQYTEEDKNVGVGIITVLPALNESIKANINCYECLSEISDIEGLGSQIILDNNELDKIALNHKFVKTFCSFLDIPAKHKSDRGNIDKAELIETIRARGMLQITEIPVQESKVSNITASFRSSKSGYASFEDDRMLKYITISTTGNVDIEQLQTDIGTPIDIFRTYNNSSTICCLAGLSFPKKRLNLVYDKINTNKDRITSVLQDSKNEMKSIDFLSGISTTSSSAVKTEKKQTTGNSKRDIMNKYLKR